MQYHGSNSESRKGGAAVPRIPAWIVLAIAACIVSLSLTSCASNWQAAPPGGPPDTTAPTVVTTLPASGAIDFHDRTISITFSEYVNEAAVPAAVVITPIPAEQPEYSWSGSTMEISFSKPLLEDRTYAVTLGSSITDLSNNRLGHPYTLRFATGHHIDSGRIQGNVLGKAQGKAFIFAWILPEDTTGFAGRFRPDSIHPEFIAPIGDDGRFSMEGIPPGRFRIAAVVDDPADQLYTPGQDAFGVSTKDVSLDSAGEVVAGISIRLRPAPDDLTAPTLYGARSISPVLTELKLSEPIDTADLRAANITVTAGGDTATVSNAWRTAASRLIVDVIHTPLPAKAEALITLHDMRDTAGNRMPDSAAHATFTVASGEDSTPPLLLPLAIDSVRAYAFPDSIAIAFDEPVRDTVLEGAVVMRDTAAKGARARFKVERTSPTQFTARPLDTLIGVQRAILEIDRRRFRDLAGNRPDSVARIPIAVTLPRQSGTLQGTLTDTAAPGAAHVVVATAVGSGTRYTLKDVKGGAWEFKALPEGEYEISAFRDDSRTGVYDYGSLMPYRHAEAYVAWQGTVRVRPRWATNGVDLVFSGR
ncbi:MAG: Ig-like domain-containing protein [Bacteroidetes bacterium]|nr:Ig-like domain-containing protein [Bacteroidota bacterium]